MRRKLFGTHTGILFTPVLLCVFITVPVYAENEPPQSETAEQLSPPATHESSNVPAPATLVATSPPDARTIVWTWGAAANQTPSGEPVAVSGYGYELSKDEVVRETGVIGADILTLTTNVSEDGVYTLRLWTVTDSAIRSSKIEAQTSVVTETPPVFVPIDEAELPPPAPLAPLQPAVQATNTPQQTTDTTTDTVVTPNAPDFTRSAEVLSASDEPKPQAAVAATVVKPSTQGWLLLGLPWYLWLLVGVMVYAVIRWRIFRRRAALSKV